MSPRKRQYRFCAQCGKKFLLKTQDKSRRARTTCSRECQSKLSRVSYRYWTEQETEILKNMAETMPIIQLIRAFNQQICLHGFEKRTDHSIRSKLQKLGFSENVQHGVYTVGMLSRSLGLPFGTVANWVKLYGLKYYRTSKKRGAIKYITAKNLRDFARVRPQSFGGVDFIDLFLILEDYQLTEYIVKNYRLRPGRIQPQPVRCIETRICYSSYVEAAKAFFVSPSAIYKSVTFGESANRHHFEKVNNPTALPKVQARLSPKLKQ